MRTHAVADKVRGLARLACAALALAAAGACDHDRAPPPVPIPPSPSLRAIVDPSLGEVRPLASLRYNNTPYPGPDTVKYAAPLVGPAAAARCAGMAQAAFTVDGSATRLHARQQDGGDTPFPLAMVPSFVTAFEFEDDNAVEQAIEYVHKKPPAVEGTHVTALIAGRRLVVIEWENVLDPTTNGKPLVNEIVRRLGNASIIQIPPGRRVDDAADRPRPAVR